MSDSTTTTGFVTFNLDATKSSVCPHCGRCKECGQPVPAVNPFPYYPQYPQPFTSTPTFSPFWWSSS